MDIDALLRETEATLFSLAPTTTEETLEDDLEILAVFQHECERILDDLTKEEAVTEGRDGKEENEVSAGPTHLS